MMLFTRPLILRWRVGWTQDSAAYSSDRGLHLHLYVRIPTSTQPSQVYLWRSFGILVGGKLRASSNRAAAVPCYTRHLMLWLAEKLARICPGHLHFPVNLVQQLSQRGGLGFSAVTCVVSEDSSPQKLAEPWAPARATDYTAKCRQDLDVDLDSLDLDTMQRGPLIFECAAWWVCD